MAHTLDLPLATDRFSWFEYADRDFPYYHGSPTALTTRQWLLLMAAVVAGFLVLILPLPFLSGTYTQIITAILFPAVPLIALASIAKEHWTAIFHTIRGRDNLWMVVFAILNIVVTSIVALLVRQSSPTTANPVFTILAGSSPTERIIFFIRTMPQLFGEEVFTILPFLALMFLFTTRLHLGRRSPILLAWVLSALWFGAAHLPTYDWNLVQCFVIIGSAQMVLSLAYIKTKNLLVSTGAHILNDWSLFAFGMLAGAG